MGNSGAAAAAEAVVAAACLTRLADSRGISTCSPGDKHVIDLAGCSVTKCPEETDVDHFAFRLTTPQVNVRALAVPLYDVWGA